MQSLAAITITGFPFVSVSSDTGPSGSEIEAGMPRHIHRLTRFL
jgi:hypothetical protein